MGNDGRSAIVTGTVDEICQVDASRYRFEMKSPAGILSSCLVVVIASALLCGCGAKDENAPKKIDVSAQVGKLKGDADAKGAALTELAAGGPGSAGAVNDIIPLLKDEDHVVRRLAAYALCQIGPAAKAAVPALKGLMNDPDRSTVTTAINALNAIAPGSIEGVKVINTTQ